MLLALVSSPEPQQPLPRAEAAIFTVNSIADTNDGTCDATNCTLREAIAATNSSAAADTINFSVSGTIILSSQLDVRDDLTINGNSITLDGNNATRIMLINSATTVTLNDLIFQNGSTSSSGGAIYNFGTLTITNSTFTDNTADYFGGVIYNYLYRTLTITNSTFSGNTAANGGAIRSNYGTLEIIDSTFSGNMASVSGGAIYSDRILTITNSTFSGNTAASGGGTMYRDYGTINVASSLMVNGDCFNGVTDGGNNLSFNATGCPGTVADPQLGPLQNNGGPTDTMLPALTGPAVDAYVAPCATATDQRGITRPQGLCDIGATEQDNTIALDTSAVCNGPDLEVTISAGDGPFNISASAGINTPVNGVNIGTTTINGPEKWDNLTVTETGGNTQAVNLGQFRCRSTEVPVPQTPAHRARTTNPFPLFSWTGISIANNYRVFVFDDANPATRTVDIRQNSGGPTSMQLSTPLPDGRLFWRVRGRQNRIWSLWSVRFTLFKDPAPPLTMNTPVPTIDINPRSGDGSVPSPAPTFPAPPNAR